MTALAQLDASSSQAVYHRYRRSMLTPAQIREMSTPRPARAMADVALSWTFILAAFALVALHTTWWTVLLAFPVIGNRYYALFIIAHDGMHRRLFPTIKRN
ncbi:MAG TPA: hypothetical protein VMI93_10250, partial [Candidatus Solibacter sp.]|nr:hypothetical protein [Candidatus Solibacter sp.]